MSTTGSSSQSQTRRTPISPVVEGDVVDGKYRVERTIAAGGMGVVVAAKHLVLEQPVALKFLIPHVQDEQLVARFLREARAAARIQSHHVVRVFDCGTLPSGVPFMAMELLEGRDLGQEIRARGPLPVEEAVDLVLAALEGLAAAHAIGIVHRDLKPSNLFLASSGRARTVKVVDFGISKPLTGPDAPIDDELTGTAIMLGSPRYASPEQAQSSRDVDLRTDIWSIGVVLYELLDGKCPYAGASMGEILGKVLLYRPPPLSQKRGDVPAPLDAVIASCIVRDRDARFPDVAALAAALEPFASAAGKQHAARAAEVLGSSLEEARTRAAAVRGGPTGGEGELEATTIEPSVHRGPAVAEGVDAAADPGRPARPEPGEATASTFAASQRAPGPRLGVVVAVAVVAGLGAVASFVALSAGDAGRGAVGAPAAGGSPAAPAPAESPLVPAARGGPAPPTDGPTANAPPADAEAAVGAAAASAAPPPSAAAPSASASHASTPPRAPQPPPRPPRAPAAPAAGILDRSD